MMQPAADQLKKRDRTKLAVDLAMERKWDEAVAVNKDMLEETPDNLEALNRLGKALTELGRYSEARASFQRVLQLAPTNTIAKKNLDRIALLRDEQAPKTAAVRQAAPAYFFIEETGKTGSTALIDVAKATTLAKLTAGETVVLEPQEHKLLVKNSSGEYVGTVEPKLGLRLLRIVRGGNRYEAAIASVNESAVRLIIRETYQHPSQHGKLSFPPAKGHEVFRGDISASASSLWAEDDEETAAEPDENAEEEEPGLEDASTYKRRGRARKDPDVEGEAEES